MRLINTKSLKLEEFGADNAPLYAILSHRWGNDEVSYQDMKEKKGQGKEGYKKIEQGCSVARKHGFSYIWIDTCCIDKESSSELSEAINSMYRWYQESAVCYAYLFDVQLASIDGKPTRNSGEAEGTINPKRAAKISRKRADNEHNKDAPHKNTRNRVAKTDNNDEQSQQAELTSDIGKSNWFKRGWTLQELIAPPVVIFLDLEWQEIGTKSNLQSLISEITGIPDRVLGGDSPQMASIAQRMSWASKRETTRPEDLAYCLMGIFDVHMPMLYGEKEKAFIRLQEEILKVSDDQSIFAWESSNHSGSLLAPSPAAFCKSSKIIPLASSNTQSSQGITVSNKGVNLEVGFLNLDRPSSHNTILVTLQCGEEGNFRRSIGIYLKLTLDNSRHFLRSNYDRLEFLDLDGLEVTRKYICVERERPIQNYKSALRLAIVNGEDSVVRLMLEKGYYFDETVLDLAAEMGHQALVRLLLEYGAAPNGTALALAAKNGHEAIVRLLFQKGASLDRMALLLAAENGHKAVVKLLFDKGASLDMDALYLAAKNGHEAVVKLLFDKGASLDMEALYLSAENGHETVVRLLLAKGPLLDERTLELAAENGHEAVVKLLLEARLLLNETDLAWAIENSHQVVVKLLLEKGATPDKAALGVAAENGCEAIVRLLLAKGCLIEKQALEMAAKNGHEAIVSLLLESGAAAEGTALVWAAEYGHEAIVRLLFQNGAPLDGAALVEAAKNGHEAIVRLLFQKGATLDRRSLILPAENGHEGVVKLILEKGASFNGLALTSASKNGHEAVVKLLLAKGSPSNGNALEAAAKNGHEAVVKLLFEKRPGLDKQLIESAAENGHEAIVKILFERGAPLVTKALASAANNGHEAVVKLLLERAASPDETALASVRETAGNTKHKAISLLLLEYVAVYRS